MSISRANRTIADTYVMMADHSPIGPGIPLFRIHLKTPPEPGEVVICQTCQTPLVPILDTRTGQYGGYICNNHCRPVTPDGRVKPDRPNPEQITKLTGEIMRAVRILTENEVHPATKEQIYDLINIIRVLAQQPPDSFKRILIVILDAIERQII